MAEVEAGDLEKFIDEIFQPQGLVQCDTGVAGAGRCGQVWLLLQQGQVADDAGQRGLEVVGQVDHQIVFALLGLPCGLDVLQRLGAHQVQLVFCIVQCLWQQDGLLRRVCQRFGGLQ